MVSALSGFAIMAAPTAIALATHFADGTELERAAAAPEHALAPTPEPVERVLPLFRAQGRALQFHGDPARVPPTITPTPTATFTPTATPTATPPSTPTATPTPKPTFVWPADGWISQPMWQGHPYGIDIAVNTGSSIYAVRDGVVTYAGGDPCCQYGYFVFIEHGDGWTSLYGHLSAFAVQAGDIVTQGQLLGLSGATGMAFGAHLHFELRTYGAPVDPIQYITQQ